MSETVHKLVLLRHGQSTWNQENRFTGWKDVPLSEKGVQEAREAGRRMAEAGLALDVSDEALDWLGKAGFDPVYGARPLKRAIQQSLENPLAQKILAGDYAPGDAVAVTVEGGELKFARGKAVLEAVG